MTIKNHVFPEAYTPRLAAVLARLGTSLTAASSLAAAVMKLSNHYISQPDAPTPWHEPWAQIAYLTYFWPLNYIRVQGVLAEGQRVGFFTGVQRYTDFGSGLGTVSLALDDRFPGQFTAGAAIERASVAVRLHRELQGTGLRGVTPVAWLTETKRAVHAGPGSVAFFSFALTELTQLPPWVKDCEALVLIEPGTHQDGRRLLKWRAELLAEKSPTPWSVWAPCTHAKACPLLTHSARDWCHDRVHWQAPAWFEAIEEHLPMKNPSLAYSYLLLRRQPAPVALHKLARLTGDQRREKGATRQMVCRGLEREFLSWQHKHGEVPEWPRGALVQLNPKLERKSNELRPPAGTSAGDVIENFIAAD